MEVDIAESQLLIHSRSSVVVYDKSAPHGMEQDYAKFTLQKYSVEHEELKSLVYNHGKIMKIHNQVMNQYKCMVILATTPNYLFAHPGTLVASVWRVIENIKTLNNLKNNDEYNLIKLNESLDIILNGYQLSNQERDAICTVLSLPRNTQIEKFIANARIAHIGNYIRRQLLPYWKDKLSPECIKYVTTENEKNIKDTNEFIAKEDLLNTVYFVNPRPITWREQLIDAGIPFDD